MNANVNYVLAKCWVVIILCYLTPSVVLWLAGACGRANVGFGCYPVLKCFE